MSNLKNFLLFAALPMSLLGPATLAQNVTVSGQLSVYPALVQAQTTGCYGRAPVSFGYSVDNQSKFNRGLSPYSINALDASILPGSHIIRFKTWTNSGECPRLDMPITVNSYGPSGPPSPAPGPTPKPTPGPTPTPGNTGPIPSNAVAVELNGLSRWAWSHDPGTPGSSVGSSSYPVANPSLSGTAREFKVAYSGHGGEIYHVSFANDASATHFVYDTYVYVTNPADLANLELDMNQVTADGRTIILGTQCSTYSKSWEYTTHTGGRTHWNASNIPCNPLTWSANTWHHIQIASHRDDQGVATYDWVNFDGTLSYFSGASGADAKSLGWQRGDLLVNVQVDGASRNSGSIQIFLDKLKVYRW